MKKKDRQGFTLLELIISLAIIGLILLGFFRVIYSTTKINEKNDRDIKGMNLAQSEVENLRSQIKSKGNSGYIEINNIINPHIENPKNGDINTEGIKIPLGESSDGDIRWKVDEGSDSDIINKDCKFILEVADQYNDYTNQEEIVLKDKNNKDMTVEARSSLIYKKKYSDNKYYTVKLVIKRKNAINNNDGTKMYLYDISAYTNSDDSYFSKKEVDINNVVLLTGKSSAGSGGGTNPPVDPPIDPPIIPDSDNYLLYCLNKAASLFKQAGKNDLYNMIMVDKFVGNKTLIQMATENIIDVVSCKQQLNKILDEVKKELGNTNNNTQIDFINEAEYYSIVGTHILEYLSVEVKPTLDEVKTIISITIKDGYIDKYNTVGCEKLTSLISRHADGFEEYLIQKAELLGEELKHKMDHHRGIFSDTSAQLYQNMHNMWNNPTDITLRKSIEDEINKFIDLIIKHQVYDVKKTVREQIPVDSRIHISKVEVINEVTKEALGELDKAKKDLVYIKALLHSANYYNKNN